MTALPIPDLRPMELLALWSELNDAYHGKNGYGGDTAELYAYRFDTYAPTRHGSDGHAGNPSIADDNEANAERARRLYDLLTLFSKLSDCVVSVNGRPGRKVGKWMLAMRFDHRVHVQVTHKRPK